MSGNRNQHIVSAFYLKRFANQDGRLWALPVRGGEIFGPVAPESLARERDAFSICSEGQRNDSYDQINSNVENYCAPELSRLKVSQLAPGIINAIFALTANFLLRSRRFRDAQIGSLKRISEMMRASEFPSPTDESEGKVLALFGLDQWDPVNASESCDRISHLLYPMSQGLLEDVASHLERRQFDLLEAPEGAQFITSDDPAVPIRGALLAEPTQSAVTLLEDPDTSVILPLAPKFACRWAFGAKFTTSPLSVAEVGELNRLLFSSAYKQAFSPSKSALESLRACNLDKP